MESETTEAKRQLLHFQNRVRQAIELIDGKNVSRAKMLLKVDCEFLRRAFHDSPQKSSVKPG